jgi:predicted phage terminase large subunit-like protein
VKCPRCRAPSVFEAKRADGADAKQAEDRICSKDARHTWFAPQPGPQSIFLSSMVDELLYGGAAGGGKSWGLVLGPLRWCMNPDFNGLLLRRETPQLEALIALTRRIYTAAIPGARAVQAGGGLIWRFPAGGRLTLTHCKEEADAFNYQGREFHFIGFDELTHFLLKQFDELKSRIRSPYPGLPRYIRATSNPGGAGHEWVFKLWGPWLDPECETMPWLKPRFVTGENNEPLRVPPLQSGEIAYVEITDEGQRFIPKPAKFDPNIHRTRQFIGATVDDNKILVENDPRYKANLRSLDSVRSAQLLKGDWLIKPAPGLYFKRGWFKLASALPAGGFQVRYWDRAGSESDRSDWTVGLKMVRIGDLFYVVDVVRFQGDPGLVQETIVNTATADGVECMQVLELDPGQAGLVEMTGLIKALKGFNAQPWKPTGDKVVRASAVSPQCRDGNVYVFKKAWLGAFFSELEAFPSDDEHDDQVDALSGAFSVCISVGGEVKGSVGKTTNFESQGIA